MKAQKMKKRRIVYDVGPTPKDKKSYPRWMVRRRAPGEGRESFFHRTKREAVLFARDAARLSEPPGSLTQVVVRGRDGKIQTEWTYGEDPRRTVG